MIMKKNIFIYRHILMFKM